MQVTPENTDFVVFYVGIAQSELDELKRMMKTFRQFYSHDITILDMSKATFAAIEKGERLWQQERAFTEDLVPDITAEDTDAFFKDYEGQGVYRIEAEYYQPRGYRTNKAIYEYFSKPLLMMLDSDMEFKSGTFFEDASKYLENHDLETFGAMSEIIAPLPFAIDKPIYGGRRMDPFRFGLIFADKLKDFIQASRQYLRGGVGNYDSQKERFKGSFPRLDPSFILLNREQFTKRQMTYRMIYFEVDDYTSGSYRDWRILGDEGAIIYDLIQNNLRYVNVDFSRWVEHKMGSWQHIKKKNFNWFHIGRELEFAERSFWQENKIPEKYIYKPDQRKNKAA